jgi:putative lysine transport system ATP-binding protein
MAYISSKIHIAEEAKPIRVELFFPTDLPDEVGNDIKGVITLLHGASNTGLEWVTLSAAYRYAADNGYVLVCPDAGNSFYHDMAYGASYYRIITEYLPIQLARIFRIPTERAVNHLAGLSMGGYGALRIGLLHPERYATIGAFSGCVDLGATADVASNDPLAQLLRPVFGEGRQTPPDADLFSLAQRVAALPAEQRPRIFASCGLQDNDLFDVLGQNRRFASHARALPLDFHYLEWEGVHEWNFWDRSLAEFIGFIQSSDYAQRKRADWSTPTHGL